MLTVIAIFGAAILILIGMSSWIIYTTRAAQNENQMRMREIHLIHLQETRKEAQETRRFLRQMDAHIAMILERIDARNH